jgi:hypothetical protein
MATTIARDPYLFWVRLMASIVRGGPIFLFVFHDLEYLTVYDVGAADDSQNGENRDEDAPQPKPFVDVESDEKTEADAPGHGEADLHDDGEVFRPGPVFFVIEEHDVPIRRLTG